VPANEIVNEKYKAMGVQIDVRNEEIKIHEGERDNHVFLDDDGVKRKVKTYDRTDDMRDT
jgi:hypothetical protein